MTLASWELAVLALIVVALARLCLAVWRNGWSYIGRQLTDAWWNRPRPVAVWLSQDRWQRRRQTLAGLGVALIVAMLLAVALRGIFVSVFVLMLIVATGSVLFGAVRGSIELRRGSPSVARQLADLGPDAELQMGPYAETGIFADRGRVPSVEVGPIELPPSTVADDTPLMFEPLGIDPIPSHEDSGSFPGAHSTGEPPEVSGSSLGAHSAGEPPEVASGPTFAAAPGAGRRQASARARSRKRRQARPIYIESTLDAEFGDVADDPGRTAEGR